MKSKYQLFFALAFLILLWDGCTKEVDYLIANKSSVPVLYSLMNPDSIITVYISQSISVSDNKYQYVNKAEVLLYCNDVLVDTLQYNFQQKNYQSVIYPLTGKKYKIAVKMPDGKRLWGETTIPIKPDSCYPLFAPELYYYDDMYLGELEIDINDSSMESDYYELLVLLKYSTFYRWYSLTIHNDVDPVLLNEGDWGFRPLTIFFSDELFNGKK